MISGKGGIITHYSALCIDRLILALHFKFKYNCVLLQRTVLAFMKTL